ncbi:hypothetical protein PCYB_005100, partial [Plasmodium cynomolgi strain B]
MKQENEGEFKDHHCNLLSLWIYEQLDRIFKDNHSKVSQFYANFLFILSKVFTNSDESQIIKCLRDFSVFFPLNNWKIHKDLYEYCVDYDKIIVLADSSDEKCTKYEEYIQEKTLVYNEFQRLYKGAYNKDDVFYEKCKRYYTIKTIPELKCEEKTLAQGMSKADLHCPGLLD